MFKNRWEKITEFHQKKKKHIKTKQNNKNNNKNKTRCSIKILTKKKNVFVDVCCKTQDHILDLERCSVVKNICCSHRRPKFNPQNLCHEVYNCL